MSERNLFDEAARVLAMPIPRRKAINYVMTGIAGAVLSLAWPKRATAATCTTACGGSCTAECCTPGGCKPCPGHCVLVSGLGCRCKKNRQGLQEIRDAEAIPDIALTREGSLAAGNCPEGTRLVASWFPGRHSVSAREVAAAAIARGKPDLLPSIAHTAWAVYWGTSA